MFFWMFRYDIRTSNQWAWKLDRWTHKTEYIRQQDLDGERWLQERVEGIQWKKQNPTAPNQ
jgi:hypothetical protein